MTFREDRDRFSKFELAIFDLDELAHAKRVELNVKEVYQRPPYPYEWESSDWRMSEEHLAPFKIEKDKLYYFINDNPGLIMMKKLLETELVIAIDCEFGNDNNFHIITALIQISSKSYDFVVDSLRLYNSISETLSDIFLNANILKVVFGSPDVLAFQRDFNLNMYPIFDLQCAFKELELYHKIPSMQNVVKEYLNVNLDKSLRNFNFLWRPLPQQFVDYARDDSKYLLECFNIFLERHSEKSELSIFEYTGHRSLMLKSYSFPKVKSELDCRKFAEGMLIKSGFKFIKQFDKNLFSKMYIWRLNTAKLLDKVPSKLFSDVEMYKIASVKPSTLSELDNCGINLSNLKIQTKGALLFCIRRYESDENVAKEKSNEESSTDICLDFELDEPSEVAMQEITAPPEDITARSVMITNPDHQDNKYVEYNVNDSCVMCERGLRCRFCNSSVQNNTSVKNPFEICAFDPEGNKFTLFDLNNGNVSYKPARNYLWKKRKELNCRYVNEHRAKHGLRALHFKKNRGVKARLKAASYRKRFLEYKK